MFQHLFVQNRIKRHFLSQFTTVVSLAKRLKEKVFVVHAHIYVHDRKSAVFM